MRKNTRYTILIAMAVSLGGFLFGFDASVISGVVKFIVPEFDLSEIELGWAVASLTFTSTIAMLLAGPISDKFGRKKLLIVVAFLYLFSAMGSAFAPAYWVLVVARMLGGFAVGASLILAPMYIAEVSPAEKRGQMVSINQLNIVLGFSAAYFCNYFLLNLSGSDTGWVQQLGIDVHTWRWMLGIEIVPALLFFLVLFIIPESPRWLIMQGRKDEANDILAKVGSQEFADQEIINIKESLKEVKIGFWDKLSGLFSPAMKLVIIIGLIVGILQQITGINAVFFYAPSIFEQSGVGTNAAFSQAVWVGVINVIFTLIAIAFIDRVGRKPLLLIGVAGVAFSMFLAAYEFNNATYTLSAESLSSLSDKLDVAKLDGVLNVTFDNDLSFKKAIKGALGNSQAAEFEADLIKKAITMNPILILIGILGFVASFAISLGPVMWVLFSELFPNWIRGFAISLVGVVNSAISFLVQLLFPWELANLGNAMTFAIYGSFAVIGFFLILKMLPETKGKSLEEIEKEFVGT